MFEFAKLPDNSNRLQNGKIYSKSFCLIGNPVIKCKGVSLKVLRPPKNKTTGNDRKPVS